MNRSILPAVLGIAFAGTTGAAHHSIAAVYDSNRPVRVNGTIVRIEFINPHPFIFVEVEAADGRAGEWRLEMDNRWELAAAGMTADTLRPGDRVVVAGSMARTQPNSLYIKRLERPSDGLLYEQIGSSPRIRRPSARGGDHASQAPR
jgi:hypothetical protein